MKKKKSEKKKYAVMIFCDHISFEINVNKRNLRLSSAIIPFASEVGRWKILDDDSFKNGFSACVCVSAVLEHFLIRVNFNVS